MIKKLFEREIFFQYRKFAHIPETQKFFVVVSQLVFSTKLQNVFNRVLSVYKFHSNEWEVIDGLGRM
jgi:hypothetical protein